MSKIHQKSIFLPFSESSCPALYAGPFHFLHLLLKKYKKTAFYQILPNFIVKTPEKTPKSGKIRPCEVYVTALIYKNEEKESSPIIQFFKNRFLKGDT